MMTFLGRAQIGQRLTNLIRTQSVPFVVSIDGYWGTGKTFMLKRWQRDLEKQGFQSIYFNAWEDDFCDDPLLAVIGQLSEHFEKEGKFRARSRQVIQSAKSLFRPRYLGMNFSPDGVSSVGISASFDQTDERNPIDEYLVQRATKDEVRGHLSDFSISVADETGHPLVFIIDELDRCRPTFAIKLLERVKHIFDVPNLVFVFGINRDELCKSVQSIFGEIDADVYLRRFFDLDIALPAADQAIYCRHILEKFELREFFETLGENSASRVPLNEFRNFENSISLLWANLGLSLRDIDYCVTILSSVCKNMGSHERVYPALLGVLIPLKIANPSLYSRYVQGQCRGSEVMDYIDGMANIDGSDGDFARTLDTIESYLYVAEQRNAGRRGFGSTAGEQIQLLISGTDLTHPELLSQRTQGADRERALDLMGHMANAGRELSNIPGVIEYLAKLINLQLELIRR